MSEIFRTPISNSGVKIGQAERETVQRPSHQVLSVSPPPGQVQDYEQSRTKFPLLGTARVECPKGECVNIPALMSLPIEYFGNLTGYKRGKQVESMHVLREGLEKPQRRF